MSWGFQSLFGVDCINMLMESYSMSQSASEFRKENLPSSVIGHSEEDIDQLNKTMESINLNSGNTSLDDTIPLEYPAPVSEINDTFNETSPESLHSLLEEMDISAELKGDSNINDEEEENIEGLLNAILPNDFGSFTLERIDQSATESQPSVLPVSSLPPLLCRHPPPASGRDDDILVLKKMLDDIPIKTDVNLKEDKIIFAPDYKIAKNLLKLIDTTEKYKVFTPEFPILNLRKSKITNLISAYKATGLLHILRYMKDEENEKDWTKLLTIENIETATRNIWRLSVALHLSFSYASCPRFQKKIREI
ncbi:unnamed protein product [Mytilus coruscus]|uniref:Uncharacterized protein n=1 Tax=Mytilus coruscus TaxID=42192 RepID=A0A6J8DEV1_MYTCO|nr:unnamed protein product [Mytilus coruscus]